MIVSLPVFLVQCWFSYLGHLLPAWVRVDGKLNEFFCGCLNTLFLPGSLISWLAGQPNRSLPTWLTIWLKGWITDCNADWLDSMLGWWLSGWMDLDGYLHRLTVVHWMISKLNGGVAGRVNGWLDGWTSFRIGYCGYLLPVSWLDSLIGLECCCQMVHKLN